MAKGENIYSRMNKWPSVVALAFFNKPPYARLPVAFLIFAIIIGASARLMPQKPTSAPPVSLTPAKQFQLFLKLLSYERTWKKRSGPELKIAILYDQAYEPSLWTKEDLMALVSPSTTIEDVPVRLIELSLEKKEEWPKIFAQENIIFLYLTPLKPQTVSSQLRNILSLCRQFKVATFTGEVSYVELGVALGLGVQNQKPHIFVNLRAAREQGLDLSSRLLQITSIR